MLKRALFGIVVLLVGAVWLGQGVGVIHGSFMSGHLFWAIAGGVLVVLGVAMLMSAWRIRNRRTA
jgi:hypothetical protein